MLQGKLDYRDFKDAWEWFYGGTAHPNDVIPDFNRYRASYETPHYVNEFLRSLLNK